MEGDWRRVRGRYVRYDDGQSMLSGQGEPIVQGPSALETLEATPGQDLSAGNSVRFNAQTAFRVLDAEGNMVEVSDGSAALILFNPESDSMKVATEREMQKAGSEVSQVETADTPPATTVDMSTANSVMTSGEPTLAPNSGGPSPTVELTHEQIPTASAKVHETAAARPTTLATVTRPHRPDTHVAADTAVPLQTIPAEPALLPMASLPYKCTDEWQLRHMRKSKPKKCVELVDEA